MGNGPFQEWQIISFDANFKLYQLCEPVPNSSSTNIVTCVVLGLEPFCALVQPSQDVLGFIKSTPNLAHVKDYSPASNPIEMVLRCYQRDKNQESR